VADDGKNATVGLKHRASTAANVVENALIGGGGGIRSSRCGSLRGSILRALDRFEEAEASHRLGVEVVRRHLLGNLTTSARGSCAPTP
jgi:hypothetical protein